MERTLPSFTTPDLITYIVCYNDIAARTLKRECGLGITEYRMLAYLGDHAQGARPSHLSRVLGKTPGMISISTGKMLDCELILRCSDVPGRPLLRIAKPGIDRLRDADLVLARTYEEYFAPLPAKLRAVLDTGSMATNTARGEGNRMREGHFFAGFEILHAFLIVEEYLTKATYSENLALSGFRILYALHEAGGMLAPNAICRELIMKPPAAAYEIKRLASTGHVRRIANNLDKRSSLIGLSDGGDRVFQRAFAAVEEVFTAGIRPSGQAERDAYKDIAAYIVSALRMQRM